MRTTVLGPYYLFLWLPRWLSGKEICLPMQETQGWSLGQEDPLEKEMAIHPSIVIWRISETEKPGGLQFMGLQKVRHNLRTEPQLGRQVTSLFYKRHLPFCLSLLLCLEEVYWSFLLLEIITVFFDRFIPVYFIFFANVNGDLFSIISYNIAHIYEHIDFSILNL